MAKAKSALDRLKEMPNKELVKRLDCPREYGITGIYQCTTEDIENTVDESMCHRCWTKKF